MKRLFLVFAVFLLSTGCGKKGTSDINLPGIKDVTFQITKGTAYLNFTLDGIPTSYGAKIPIPKLDDAYFEFHPGTSYGELWTTFAVPLESLFDADFNTRAPLPGGRPIPGIKSGMLPSSNFNTGVDGIGWMRFYLSEEVFGIFVPFQTYDLPLAVTFRIRDKKGNTIGYITAIPKDANGLYDGLLFLFPTDM